MVDKQFELASDKWIEVMSSPESGAIDEYKNLRTKEGYDKVLKSGMFWEFHPELTGNWWEDGLTISRNAHDTTTINNEPS